MTYEKTIEKPAWSHDDIVFILDKTGMPQDLADIIMALRYRVAVLSDNDIAFDKGDITNGRIAQEARALQLGRLLAPGTYLFGDLRTASLATMFDTIGQMTKCDECLKDSHELAARDAAYSSHEEYCSDGDECTYLSAERDAIDGLVDDLYDHVEGEHTPCGHYFGALEGDGADIGVWEVVE